MKLPMQVKLLRCTKYVVLHVIKEQCARYGCRYVELPGMKKKLNAGRVDFFVSHAWNGDAQWPHFREKNRVWETLVSAVKAHSDEMIKSGRFSNIDPPRYWVDIFAVNQFWPSKSNSDDQPNWDKREELENMEKCN